MPYKNFYTANSVEPGDIFIVTLKAMVQYSSAIRLYRCPWPKAEIGDDGSPQGDWLPLDDKDARRLARLIWPTAMRFTPGEIYAAIVKAEILPDCDIATYKCVWPDAPLDEQGLPIGDVRPMAGNEVRFVAETLFPIIRWAREAREEA